MTIVLDDTVWHQLFRLSSKGKGVCDVVDIKARICPLFQGIYS